MKLLNPSEYHRRTRITTELWILGTLFLSIWSFYTLSMPGVLGMDEETMFLVTQSIVEEQNVSLENGLLERYTERIGVNGKRFSQQEIGQPLLGIIFYLPAKWCAGFLPASYRPFFLRISVQSAGPIAGAFSVVLLYILLKTFGMSTRISLFTSSGFAFSSPMWFYGSTFFRAPVMSTLILSILLLLYVFLKSERTMFFLLSCTAATVLCIVKAVYLPITAVVLGGSALYLILIHSNVISRAQYARITMGYCFFLICSAGVNLWYNQARFGSPFQTGYDLSAEFSTPLLEGLTGMLFSPGQSLFLFAPLLLFAIPGAWIMYRRQKAGFYLCGAFISYQLLVFSKWYLWEGGFGSWGPRHAVPIIGPLFVFAAFTLDHLSSKKRLRAVYRVLIGLCFVAGVAGQTMGNLTGGDFLVESAPKRNLQQERWTIRGSRILSPVSWRSLGALSIHRLSNPPDPTRSVQTKEMKQVQEATPRLWWLYLYRLGFPVLYLLPAGFLVLCTCVSMYFLLRTTCRFPQ